MNKIIILTIVLLTSASLMFAQLQIEISSNMQVETTGGVYISGASNVIENGSGYLKGVVESSTLTNPTEFAGLTLQSGFSGIIKRTTGTALSTAPKTFLRHYNLTNNSGAYNSNVSSKFVSVGNNEQNNIGTPFIYKKVGSDWTGHNNTSSTANVASASSVNIPNGISDLTISEGIGVAARIFLEGPYTSNAMSTSINASIPTVSPYTEDPRTAVVPGNAVDWVLVSLRNATTPSIVIASRSAFVNSAGFIIDDLGNTHTGVPAGCSCNLSYVY